jgi:hypothetical protein
MRKQTTKKQRKVRFDFTEEERETAEQRIKLGAEVDQHLPDKCSIWKQATDQGGYGQAFFNGILYPAHRLSHVVHTGATPEDMEGKVVMHLCHNPQCVNPFHLSLGTQQQNMSDCANAGRLSSAIRSTPELADDVVRQIIASASTMTIEQRMETFNVGRKVIYRIDKGISYKRIPRPVGWTPPEYQKATPRKFPGWNAVTFKKSFEKIEKRCTPSREHHFKGTSCLLPKKQWTNGASLVVRVNNKQYRAYVIACMFRWQCERPEGKVVCHLCDTKNCCRPEHLEFGTQKKNCEDTVKMGRHKKAKLNPVSVVEIRKLYQRGISQRSIGELYGVSQHAISDVVNKESWSFVE